MKIGARIKARRKALGISADKLAERLGKDRSTIFRYEKGDIENLPLDILEPIAQALSTTPAYLMGWDEQIENNPVELAERHTAMIMDADLNELYDDFRVLDAPQKKIVKDLVRGLAATKKGSS